MTEPTTVTRSRRSTSVYLGAFLGAYLALFLLFVLGALGLLGEDQTRYEDKGGCIVKTVERNSVFGEDTRTSATYCLIMEAPDD